MVINIHKLYSVEEVSERLGLQVRTVRHYLRSGRLKGVRIGKQYRITREALEAMTGTPAASDREDVARHRHVDVSSIVQIDAISPDAANRVTNMLMAAAKAPREGDQPLRVDTGYDEERGRMKVFVGGSVETSVSLLRMIAKLTEPES